MKGSEMATCGRKEGDKDTEVYIANEGTSN
jgi:hypothetical protein